MMHTWDLPKRDLVRVLEAVCEEFEVTVDELKSPDRKSDLVDARCAFAYLMRHRFKYSLHRIAVEISRDHSAVVNQLRRIDDLIFIKDPIAEKLGRVEKQLFKQTIFI